MVGAAALVLALSPSALAGQTTTGSITGTVTGDQNQPIEGAQVQVVNRSTGFTAGVMTRGDGRYTVPGLEVGSNYSVTVRRIGFQPQTNEPVVVTLGQATRVDFALEAQVAQLGAVTVTAVRDPVISPTRNGSQTTISDTVIARLPTLDRNFTDFAALTPQVSTTGPGLSGGGTNNRFNNIKIDGATEADLFGLGSTGQPGGQADGKSIGIESVKEYQVLLSPYDVRQGNFSGALINAVTKSGANELFGSAFIVGRNEELTRTQPYLNEYEKYQYGFSVGGPIVRDKAFFFINPEIQSLKTPASGLYWGAPGLTLSQADLTRFQTALQNVGIEPGGAGQVTNENPLRNIFARLDFNLPGGNTLVLRHNYAYARDDNFSRGSTGTTPFFPLTSNGYRFTSQKNATVAQLRSIFGNGMFNEFQLGYTTIRDRRSPNVRGPQVTAFAPGAQLQAGSERFSHGNELDQDILEITENLTLPAFGGHSITIGTQNQFYKPRNLFAQSTFGAWTFGTLDSLDAGLAREYIVGVPAEGDGSVTFNAAQYSAYIQDEWTVSDRLNVTFGLRADIPTFGDKPPENPDVLATFGRSTAEVPTGNLQWSPRFGFNYDLTGDQTNQLRGGAGLFTGRPAFVWLSNAFQNSGLSGVALLTCRGAGRVPMFDANAVANPPQACANGTTASLGAQVDLLNEDLKFPQNLRATLGYDRRVTNNWTATVEGLYTRGVNNLFYQNIALSGPIGVDRNGRVLYGERPFAPALVDPDRTVVTDVSNQSKDWSYQLTGGIQRQYRDNYSASLFYTYSQVRDVQALTSSTAFSQYRFGRAWAGDQSDDTPSRSVFEQRHKVVAYGTYTLPSLTDITLSWIGGSGMPYHYVSDGDLNGDGISLNDPLYIPLDARDPNEILFQTFTQDGVTYTAAEQAEAFEQYIESVPCLRRSRGTMQSRNVCENPWQNQVNLSVRQSLKTLGSQRATVQLDVFNLGNLLNREWGTFRSASANQNIDLLDQRFVQGNTNLSEGGQHVFRFTPGEDVYRSNFFSSNYTMQLMLRYSF